MNTKINPVPNIGDEIYIPVTDFPYPAHDVIGGLATVELVIPGISGGEETTYIVTVENPDTKFNWADLSQSQEQLKNQYGQRRAHLDCNSNPKCTTRTPQLADWE